MSRNGIEVRPLSGAGGAELLGVDLSRELDPGTWQAIHAAFLEHIALFFPGQRLEATDIERFVLRFGEPLVHPYLHPVEGSPYVHELRKEPSETVNFGNGWHADFTFLERPSSANSLYARVVPEFGGDTMFINTCMAYDALSEGMKRMLGGMRAVHRVHPRYLTDVDTMANRKGKKIEGEFIHPCIRTHPESGRKVLYINPSFVPQFEGMTEAESAPILEYLGRFMAQPEFQIRYRWQQDTFGIWDNRCSLHTALNDYHGKLRVMHRMVVLESARPA
ncbi:MAG: TauD/TfdA family dioxygenase [Steroidobacteraceae bacterium]